MVEGEEVDAFWDALGDDEDYVSYLGGMYCKALVLYWFDLYWCYNHNVFQFLGINF